MAQRQRANINVYQGDDRNYKFTLTSGGSAYSVAGASSIKLRCRETTDSKKLLFECSATDSSNGNNWAGGIVVFAITAAQSLVLLGDAVYDVSITKSDGKIVSPVYGSVLVQRRVEGS